VARLMLLLWCIVRAARAAAVYCKRYTSDENFDKNCTFS